MQSEIKKILEQLKSVFKSIERNAKNIEALSIKVDIHDTSIVEMRKDYEYMKKSLDNIEHDSKSSFNAINLQLKEIYNQNHEEAKKRLKQMDDYKNHVIKQILTGIVGAVAGAIIAFYF